MYEESDSDAQIYFNDDGVKNSEGATLYLSEYNHKYSVAGWKVGNGFQQPSISRLKSILKYYFPNSWSSLYHDIDIYDVKDKPLIKHYDGWTVEITWQDATWY